MSDYSPTDLAAQLKSGLLSFPVTHFTDELAVDEAAYREHLAWLAEYPVAGLFAAGGTGEGFSLSAQETDQVVRAAVEEVQGAFRCSHPPPDPPRTRSRRPRPPRRRELMACC